ncbi:MAG: hypothetical protein NZM26_05435, partial [Patescibacteria group bacterium]|nr:hypothetical protein [Patescibacteria group bacterium]
MNYIFSKFKKENFAKLSLFIFLILFLIVLDTKISLAACQEGEVEVNYDKNSEIYKSNCLQDIAFVKSCSSFCRREDGGIFFSSEKSSIQAASEGFMVLTTHYFVIKDAVCDSNNFCRGGSLSELKGDTKVSNPLADAVGAVKKIGGGLTGSFIGNIASGAIATVVFVISYIISIIAGAFIALESFLITVILQINTQILNTDLVQSGFSISLAVANLFFVAMIIFVAIATILRRETYGIKAMLAKLILMAVIINFGLTIAGAIINIADIFSLYFIQSTNPGGEYADFNSFATAIAGAFTFHRFFIFGEGGEKEMRDIINKDDEQLAAFVGGSLAKIIQPIVGLFFTIVVLTMIIVTFGALVVMLLYRYVALGIMLILLPLAWMCWVFPNLQRHWNEWWNGFFRWTFFAPLALFFIYLCLLTLRGTVGGGGGNIETVELGGFSFTYNPSSQNNIAAGLAAFGGTFISQLIIPILQAIIMSACFLGGLRAADKLGIEFANSAYKRAEKAAKDVGGWVKNRARGYAASAMVQEKAPEYKGIGKVLHPFSRFNYWVGRNVWRGLRKIGGLSESLDLKMEETESRLKEVSAKYGPEARIAKKEKIKEHLEKIRGLKASPPDFSKQMQKLKDIEDLIKDPARRQQLINNLKKAVRKLNLDLQSKTKPILDNIKNLESHIKNLQNQMMTAINNQQKAMIAREIAETRELISKEEGLLNRIKNEYTQKKSLIKNRINELDEKALQRKKKEIENEIERAQQKYSDDLKNAYREARETLKLEPKTLFATIVDSVLGKKEEKEEEERAWGI